MVMNACGGNTPFLALEFGSLYGFRITRLSGKLLVLFYAKSQLKTEPCELNTGRNRLKGHEKRACIFLRFMV